MPLNSHEKYMSIALNLAQKAYDLKEVPVGAILVHNHQVIAQAHNLKETTPSALAHAEMLVIQRAEKLLRRWRLTDCTLYTTLEPCLMCTGAIIAARIGTIVYGVCDKKAGAIESVYNIFEDKKLNHTPQVIKGILAETSSQLLTDFFKNKREKSKF